MSWSRSSVSDSLKADPAAGRNVNAACFKHAACFKSSSQEGCVVHESGNLSIVSAALESENTHTHTHVHLHTHSHTCVSYPSLLWLDIAVS